MQICFNKCDSDDAHKVEMYTEEANEEDTDDSEDDKESS